MALPLNLILIHHISPPSPSLSLLPWQIGERLGFGVTIVLVLSVAEVVVAPYIPVCDNWLWSSKCVRAGLGL